MAPNRKSVTTLVESLSNSDLQSLQNTIQPKFLPLTHPQEQAETSEPNRVDSSASYWEWPTETVESTDVLSLANIESNLIQASRSQSQTVTTKAENDDYWAEDQQQQEDSPDSSSTQPQHIITCSYWDWTSNPKQAAIDSILAEERAYQMVSAAVSQAMTVTHKPSSPLLQPCRESNDSYWQWESPIVSSSRDNDSYWDWQPKNPLQALLEYERAREFLTVDNILCQLQAAPPVDCATATKTESDDYWNWSEHYGDQYWEAHPAALATASGYWDW